MACGALHLLGCFYGFQSLLLSEFGLLTTTRGTQVDEVNMSRDPKKIESVASGNQQQQQPDPHANDPLPPGWHRLFSKSNQRYYYTHEKTNHTQWHFPTASEAKNPQLAQQRVAQNLSYNNPNPAYKRKSAQEDEEAIASEATLKKQKQDDDEEDDILNMVQKASVAIIVPYRDLHPSQNRQKHLQQFVPHMIQFLQSNSRVRDFHIYIVEQSNDQRKFNRGKLLNIGYDLARKRKHDCYIFHDVDLLPQDDLQSWYSKFPTTPIHIARVWDRYSNNPKYFGGVVSFSSSDFTRINGYPNTFWGWGGEDDEMHKRLEKLGMRFDSPDEGTLVDLENMNLTEKLDFLRQNRQWKCMVKWEALDEHDKTWKSNGLSNLSYKILETSSLDNATNKATKYTVDVKLNDNHWSNEKAGIDYQG